MNTPRAHTWKISTAERNLLIGIGASLVLHVTLLTMHFKFPDASRAFADKAMEIILVNSKSARKPAKAQALAQANLDGGGNTDQERRLKTPLPPSPREQSGKDLEQAEKRVKTLEAQQQRLLAQARSKGMSVAKTDKEAQPDPTPVLSGRDLANNALAMARSEGEIARDMDEYNKRPRLKTIGLRAEENAGAAYLDSWEKKVEKIGTLNYPSQAKGKTQGMVTVWVVLRGDGSLHEIEIRRSSGHKILDEAAKRTIELGAPYGFLPKAMLGNADIVGFSRTLEYTNSNRLETRAR